jgi:hypothetical protein
MMPKRLYGIRELQNTNAKHVAQFWHIEVGAKNLEAHTLRQDQTLYPTTRIIVEAKVFAK